MTAHPLRTHTLIAYASSYLVFAAAAARAIVSERGEPDFLSMVLLLAVYLAVLMVEPWILSRSQNALHVINAAQVILALALLYHPVSLDFFSLLFIPPCAISILTFPFRTAIIWIISIVVLMEVTLLVAFPFEEAVGYAIIYPTAIFLFAGFSYFALTAQEARLRSEALLEDLQKANRKLQAYAAQVQELAAASERNRLARELHDSVTQIIFGLTLSAQAARILIDRDPKRAAAELDHMQVLAQNALAEMRSLIQQLHPWSIAEEGLAAALRRLSAERLSENGLTVELQIRGERRLPLDVEQELYSIAQEALNNITKHAQTDYAVITLNLEDENGVSMCIEDHGVGFDPAAVKVVPGHLGLTSMYERIHALSGVLSIESKPGKGARVRVELARPQEVNHVV